MIDINLIRAEGERLRMALKKRGFEADFEAVLGFDDERRELLSKNEKRRAKRNAVSAEIAKLKRDGELVAIVNAKIHDMQLLGEKISKTDAKLAKLESLIFAELSALPNIPAEEVIEGGKEANKVVKTHLTPRKFDFEPKDHVTICTELGLVDYERGAKMSGSGSWVYKGMGARLEWALLNYCIDFHIANGYEFILPPHLLNYESGFAAGQFPKFVDDVFLTNYGDSVQSTRFLLPTSETALINMHRGETLKEDELPIKYAAYSPCYRKEAGGYGASERGMIRGHQFNKIEMFAFAKPEESEALHNQMVESAEKLVEGLGLHYQTVLLAAGDTGASMQKTYDIEVHIPSMHEIAGGYKEISSASNAGDFQARRANIRFKRASGIKTPAGTVEVPLKRESAYVHTLNASGLATSRLVPAILEQFQNSDGSVTIPEVLRKYMGGAEKIS